MTRVIQYILLLFGMAGVIVIGLLLNTVAMGSGILFWVVLSLVFLYGIIRYPREEVFAVFGIAFGFFCLFVLGGAYFFGHAGYEVLAIVWLVVWLGVSLVLLRRVQRWLTPTFFMADEFARIVGPIPVRRELPRGCIVTGIETILFFLFLMIAGLLGPILWLVQVSFLLWFLKKISDKQFSWGRLLIFIVWNVIVLFVLYMTMKELHVDEYVRKLTGG